MVDETTDLSNTEQLVLCIRYVDDYLNVHEEPVGLYSLESTIANDDNSGYFVKDKFVNK